MSEPARSDEIQALLWALKPFMNLHGSLPLLITFLVVTLDEGKGVGEYARAAGFHRGTMSRYLRDMCDRARNGGPGLGLVTIEPHPAHARKRRVLLTGKGKSVAQQIFAQMRRAWHRSEGDVTADALSAAGRRGAKKPPDRPAR